MKNKRKINIIYRLLFNHFGPQHWWPGNSREEIITGAILTQNTAWANVEKAVHNLKSNNLINFHSLLNTSHSKVAALIKPSGYFNQKAETLHCFARHLSIYDFDLNRFFNQNIIELRNELLSIRGIGRETADSIILYSANKPIFVIDAYTRRIFSRNKITPGSKIIVAEKRKYEYDDWRLMFESSLEKENKLFNEYHALIVQTGKNFCKTRPLCNQCPLIKVCAESI